MVRFLFLFNFLIIVGLAELNAQPSEKLAAAFQKFVNDPQLEFAISSLQVVESVSGKIVFSQNEKMGLAPASCLKIVTAATALQLLGSSFTYKTPVLYSNKIENGQLKGDIVIKAMGDPTLGSWRYGSTKNFQQLKQLNKALGEAGITQLEGRVVVDASNFDTQATPGGWIFEDIGNYYGAGSAGFNWYENQYDLVMTPGIKVGDRVKIVGTRPIENAITLVNELHTAGKGSGDNAIIFPDKWPGGTIRGTIPAGVDAFTISGSIQDPIDYFGKSLNQFGSQNNVALFSNAKTTLYNGASNVVGLNKLAEFESPSLDTIVAQFLTKSINLYGEALLKTIGQQKGGVGSSDNGIIVLRNFWKNEGIPLGALKIKDGSGLSPQDRITTEALVKVLQYARKQPWYTAFYEGLPVINGIKMKSGTISGAKSYAGYIKGPDGTAYTFAFMVNNFDGYASTVMQKMWDVLDVIAK